MEMEREETVRGNIVPTVTYFDKNFSIDEPSCRLQALHALYHGADALFVFGSTGEGQYFLGDMRIDIPEAVKNILITADACAEFSFHRQKKKIPLLVGVFANKPKKVPLIISELTEKLNKFYKEHFGEYMALSRYIDKLTAEGYGQTAAEVLISGFVIPPPSRIKFKTEKEFSEFYAVISEKITYDIYMYNNPARFAGNTIPPEIIGVLKDKFINIKGIKDSSPSSELKKEYCRFLDERFSVTCGKEGMIGEFMVSIPAALRKFAGIVPSLSNLTNNPASVLKAALEGKDGEAVKLQNEMNSFRNDFYDTSAPTGKAQRGIKLCMAYIYGEYGAQIPTEVTPPYVHKTPDEFKEKMIKTAEYCIEKGYIVPVFKGD